MSFQEDVVTSFFKQYEQVSNTSNTESIVAMFADPFTVATPQGPRTVRVSDFADVISRRKALFDRLGCQEAALDSLKATHLNDHFALVDTTWRMRFLLPDGRFDTFMVASSFLVYLEGSAAKVFVYMPHQDIMAILTDRGILNDKR
jgi:hypothetical protein